LQKNKHGVNTLISLGQRYLYYISFVIEHSVLMVLVFYYKGMLEKVTMQRTQQFSAFSLLTFVTKINEGVNSFWDRRIWP